MTLCIPYKPYGKASYHAPTRYRRNQATRFYIGANIKGRSSTKKKKKRRKNSKPQKGFSAGATTLQFPFIKRPRTFKHRFSIKETYGASELRATIATIKLALDVQEILPEEEGVNNRPFVFYSNSNYVLDGIIKYLPKWRVNGWKSIRYLREQEKTRLLNAEYDKRYPNQAKLLEGYHKDPLEGIIANVELWQELDYLLQELDKLPNKIHFRKLARRKHLRFRKRTLKAVKDTLYEAALVIKWTQYKKHLKKLDPEAKLQESEEDETYVRNSHKYLAYTHLSRYLNLSRWSLPWEPVSAGSTPDTTTICNLGSPGFSGVGHETILEVQEPLSQPPRCAPGNDHTYVPVGTNKLPTRLSSTSRIIVEEESILEDKSTPSRSSRISDLSPVRKEDTEKSALYPFKVESDPTSVTTLSLSGTFQNGINKGSDETSIARDDLSVGDYVVPNGDQNDRDLKFTAKRDLQEGVVTRPPPTKPYLPSVQLFGVAPKDPTPVTIEKNPHGGINLRKGKRIVYGLRPDLPVFQKHKHDLNWWFRELQE